MKPSRSERVAFSLATILIIFSLGYMLYDAVVNSNNDVDSCMDFNELGHSWNLLEGTYYMSQLDNVACIDGKGQGKTFILYDSRVPPNRIMDKEMLDRYLKEDK